MPNHKSPEKLIKFNRESIILFISPVWKLILKLNAKCQNFGIEFSENFFYKFIDDNLEILNNFWGKIEKKEEALLNNISNLSITSESK